ncbi:MAG: putative RAMP superfamily DNA repair protein [Ignavibacteria bacterium]|nr:MAG: putative RAMP superfamily DNA repair protein [Ignavibacteria bacterium]KAF0158112.1 MAG: putative RAMP superfamily DNA repair protein [Ignavibacteria bacterium]
MKAYKLKFHSSFHLDSGTAVDGPSEFFIKSDTLFSAVCSAANKFYGSQIVEAFLQPSAIILSSAFPYLNEELFFPKPLNYYPHIDDYEMIKEFKKIKFLSKDYLELILQGDEELSQFIKKDFILNGCWKKKKVENDDLIFMTNENPHIVVDRITNSTQIFYKTEVYFAKDAGLFFLASINENLLPKFETVLRFLGDEGVGADRTTGKGLFEVEEITDFSIRPAANANSFYSLSLYFPTREEFDTILPKESFYDLEIRKGWVSKSTIRRKALRMFTEGSVIKTISSIPPLGSIQKVLSKKDFPEDLETDIFRNGQALFIPASGGANGSS